MQYRTLEVGEVIKKGDKFIGESCLEDIDKEVIGKVACNTTSVLRPIEPTDLSNYQYQVSTGYVDGVFAGKPEPHPTLQEQFTKLSSNYADLAGKYLALLSRGE